MLTPMHTVCLSQSFEKLIEILRDCSFRRKEKSPLR